MKALLTTFGLLLSSLFGAPDVVPLDEGLDATVAVIGVPQVHALGLTGRGVSVLVLDDWRGGHGQVVAKLIRAVAPGVGILRADHKRAGILEGFQSALRNLGNYSVLNMSFAMSDGQRNHITFDAPCEAATFGYEPLIEQIAQAGVTLVASAGNNAQTNALVSPACHPEVLSVGAVYSDDRFEPDPNCTGTLEVLDQLTCFSNEAVFLDLVAPGRPILVNGRPFDGTSAAAPLVTGTIALMLEANPALTREQIQRILKETGEPALSAKTSRRYARVDVFRAVQAALNARSQASLFELDLNDNRLIEDADVENAILLWIKGRPLPGTQRRVSDALMLELVHWWVVGQPFTPNTDSG